MLWGGKFWTSGYYVNTVGQYANEEVIKKYIQKSRRIEINTVAQKSIVFVYPTALFKGRLLKFKME